MPHAIIEYSANLAQAYDQAGGSRWVHHTLSETGVFAPENLKTRAYQVDDFQVGLEGKAGSFCHIAIYIMAGRTVEQKQQISKPMLAALQEALPEASQLSVDVRELEKDVYQKHMKQT